MTILVFFCQKLCKLMYEVVTLKKCHLSDDKNSPVNRNLACVINNWNNSSYYLRNNKVIYNFCMINELLTWFRIKIADNCFNFVGHRTSSSISFNYFWNLFSDLQLFNTSHIYLSYKKVLIRLPCEELMIS